MAVGNKIKREIVPWSGRRHRLKIFNRVRFQLGQKKPLFGPPHLVRLLHHLSILHLFNSRIGELLQDPLYEGKFLDRSVDKDVGRLKRNHDRKEPNPG